jgi:ribosomal-protein-alanine N-acetyltransferase
MTDVIETPRLLLRPIETSDTDEIHRIWTDPDVRRYLWDDQVIAREVAVDAVARSQAQFSAERHGLWVAQLRGHDDIAGFSGYWYFRDPPQLEVLYGLLPGYWHRGLATEICRAVLKHGFEVLGFRRIIGTTDPPNVASVRVMERAGMRFDRREIAAGRETLFFVIDAP